MPRLLGVDLPDNKKLLFALQTIYGVGPAVAAKVVKKARVDGDKRAGDLTNDELGRLQRALDEYKLEGDLRRDVDDNIDRLKRIKSYRGMRHAARLPVRGQRTRTNARVVRGGGPRKTIGAMSKEMAAKLEQAKTKK